MAETKLAATEMGSKGGKARAEALTRAERSEIARRGAEARWAKAGKPGVIKATHIGDLELGDVTIPCAVLEDQTRVITQQGMLISLGRARSAKGGTGASSGDADRLPAFLAAKSLKPYIDNDLREATKPIPFKLPNGGTAYGYAATLLPKVCRVYLDARQDDKLAPSQRKVARACEIIVAGLADVGVQALVDEATGFQTDRDRDALAKILEKFISDELRRWVKTFPDDYFRELCRLRGMPFRSDRRFPQYFGRITANIVYRRLAPGVLQELKAVTPRTESGALKHRLHQRLSHDIGHPKLLEHLGKVVAVMQLSDDYDEFKRKLDRVAPVHKDADLLLPYQS